MTTPDRELLELAAKAAGIKTSLHKETDSLWIDGPRVWNPLTDDGDALRLAVKLGIGLTHEGQGPSGIVIVWASKSATSDMHVEWGTDPYAAAVLHIEYRLPDLFGRKCDRGVFHRVLFLILCGR
jgi:hypothetical protein